jgi:hypothetical protein
MAINLQKGQKVDLTKGNATLKQLLVGLGWDTNKYDGGFDFDLGQKINDIFRAAIQLGMPLLTAKAFHLGYSDALYANGGKGFTHFVKLERLDDGGYKFHEWFLAKSAVADRPNPIFRPLKKSVQA